MTGGGGGGGSSGRISIGQDEAKKLILAAEMEVKAARSVVDERQHKIDAALKKVNDAEKARKNTLATMTMLAIPQDPNANPEDPTGQRLRKLLTEQTLALEQAKYGLDSEVVAMMSEEKDLKKRETEFDEKVRSAQGQGPIKSIGFRNLGGATKKAQPVTGRGGTKSTAGGAGKGGAKAPEGDDGCVIS